MAKALASAQVVREVREAMPHLKRLPSNHFWFDYDEEADVLYVSFQKPQRATNSILKDGNVLLRYQDKKLVGVTIMGTKSSHHASSSRV